jgi:hypothetical protein
MDPYAVTRLIVETVCGAADGDLPSVNGAVAGDKATARA